MYFDSSAVSNTSGLSKRQALIVLAWICALGLSIRLLHLWAIAQSAWPQHHLMHSDMDDHSFFEWAQTILGGDWLGRETYHPYFEWMKEIAPLTTWQEWWGGKEIFHQAPLYPYLLAGLLAMTHGSLKGVFLLQLLIGTVQILILYCLGSRLFDRRVGLAAASLTALYGPFIFYEATLLRDWLPPILEPLALAALLKAQAERRWWIWCATGSVLGLSLLTKEPALILILLAGAWAILASRPDWANGARSAGWLAVGLLLSLTPLVARNQTVGAPPFSLSTRAAEAIVLANTPQPLDLKRTLAVTLDRSGGQLLPTLRETLHTYRSDWLYLLTQMSWKLSLLKDTFEYPNNVSVYYGMEISPILRWCLGYGIIFPLGLAGFALFGRQSRATGLATLYVVGTVAWLLLTSPLSRHRLNLAPPLIVFAGATLVFLMDGIHQKHLRLVGIVLGLILASLVLQRAILPFPEKSKDYAYIPDYISSARAYAEAKQFARAAAEMARLIEKSKQMPGAAPLPKYLVADFLAFQTQVYIQGDQKASAREKLDEAVVMFSQPASGQEDRATHYPWFNFGLLYLKLDEPVKARLALEKFIALDPQNPLADRAKALLSKLQDSADESESPRAPSGQGGS